MSPRFGSIAVVLALSVAATLHAQSVVPRSHTTGLLIGVGAQSNVIGHSPGSERSRDSNIGGQSLTVGYGFTPTWALQAQIGRAFYKNSGGGTDWAGSIDLEVHRNFRSTASRFVPFALAGVSNRTFAMSGSSPTTPGAAYNGMGFQYLPNVGGGASLFLARSVAIRTSASVNFGKFNATSTDGARSSSFGVMAPRLSLGVLLTPGAWTKQK
jgi:hypothetical protein